MSHQSRDQNIKIAERFRVLSTLGAGGMGAVYLAHDQVLDRQVAVKMLRVKEATPDTLVRFQKEAKTIAKLNHGAIMTALDFGVTEGGEPYLVLDYLDGQTLDSVLKKCKRLSLDDAITVAIRVCEGLEYAHAAGIIHRDIKPSNIYLVDGEVHPESVRILDFGLARLTVDDLRQTASGTVMGSPIYMSPEQARGDEADERSDVYSLGCVLFQSLTGEPPIAGQTAVETLSRKLNEEPPKLFERVFDRKFPEKLEEIVARCLATDKVERYSNISATLADLNELKEQIERQRAERPADESSGAYGGETKTISKKTLTALCVGAVLIVGSAVAFYGLMTFQPFDTTQQEFRKNIEAPITKGSSQESTVRKGEFFYLPPNVENPGFFEVAGSEARFKGSPKDEDLANLAKVMRTNRISTVCFDVVEGNVSARELQPLVQEGATSLRVSQAVLTPDAIEAISKMHRLRELVLGGCQFLAPLFKNPRTFKNLEFVTMSSCYIRPDDALFIPQLEHVEALDIGKSHGVTPEFLRSLARMKSLTRLSVGGKEISMDHIDALCEIPKLTVVEFSELQAVPMADVFRRIKHLPKLNAMSVSYCSLGSADVQELSKLNTVSELLLRNVRDLHAGDWLKIARMPGLETIELYDLDFDNDEDIVAFTYSTKLKKMIATGLGDIDPKIYSQIRKHGVEVVVNR